MPITVTRAGQSYGPYSLEDLHRYVASGNILPTDLAVSDDHPQPRTVAELLAAAAPVPPPTGLPPAPWNQTQNGPGDAFQHPSVTPGSAALAAYPWFPVSTTKFVVMSLCTFGLYHVYWTYKQWDRLRDRGEDVMPWARAIFLGIFNFLLFPRIKTRADLEGDPAPWNAVFLAVLVLVFAAFSRLPRGLGVLSLLSFIPYLPVVSTINKVNAHHTGTAAESPNTSFSGINIAGIVLGGIVLLLALLGFAMQFLGLAKR